MLKNTLLAYFPIFKPIANDVHLFGIRWTIRLQLARCFARFVNLPVLLPLRRGFAGNQMLHIRNGSSDRLVFEQIFCAKELSLPTSDMTVKWVVDLGANAGYSTAWFASRFPAATILAVEPDLQNFRMLTMNTSSFGKRIIAVNAAVWGKDTNVFPSSNAYRCGRELSRQFVDSALPADSESGVAGLTLDTLLARYAIPRIDVLKIDVEGAETLIFAEHGRWLERTALLAVELHNDSVFGDPAPLFYSMVKKDFDVHVAGEKVVAKRRCL